MYAAEFEYYRATSLADARRLLREHPGARLLAGGHSLIPLLRMRLAAPPAVIDIGRIAELQGIRRDGATIRIGALTTHATLASSALVREACPMLAEAAALIGDAQVRNRGTIGGNVAHADPGSDPPTALLALGARFTAAGDAGSRTIEAGGFFQGLMATALADDEILTAIEVAARQTGQGMAYRKFPHPASRYAVVAAAASVTLADGKCTAASIAVGGVVPGPVKAPSVEAALVGKRLTPDVIAEAAGRADGDLGDDIVEDLFASADYRRAMTAVYVKRAILAAAELAEKAPAEASAAGTV